MDYKEVLEKQREQMPETIKWWPSFLYHFTDVHNASRILFEGFAYSRDLATKMVLCKMIMQVMK